MKDIDRQEYIQRYEGRLQEYGYSPQTLGWGNQGRQEVRFTVLADYALNAPNSSVLDIGCGFADLYDFLTQHGWTGHYTGIDIVPGLLEVASSRHPELDLKELDILRDGDGLEMYDYVIASGVLNATLTADTNPSHIENVLKVMHQHASVAVCVDFLSTYVDFQKPGAWHTDPGWALQVAKRLTRRVVLRHDYMPYEFALFLFCDDSVSNRNVFQAAETAR